MTLNGIDISSAQAGMNVSKIKSDFVIVKATQGTGYVNPYCNGHVSQTQKSGKKLGIYHFLEKGNATAQADYFIKNIKNYVGKGILVVDYEVYTNDGGKTYHKATVSDAKTFLDRVYSKTGVRPLIYMGLADENAYNWSSVAKNYGLWVAQYNNYNTVSGFKPRSIYGTVKHWKSMAMFQYSSAGRLPAGTPT